MKNQEVYIPRPAKAMMAEIESLKAALAVAIAERDAWLTKHDKLMDKVEAVLEHNHKVETHNQSLTTLCEELVEAKPLLEKVKRTYASAWMKEGANPVYQHGSVAGNVSIYNIGRLLNILDKALAHYAELLKKKE